RSPRSAPSSAPRPRAQWRSRRRTGSLSPSLHQRACGALRLQEARSRRSARPQTSRPSGCTTALLQPTAATPRPCPRPPSTATPRQFVKKLSTTRAASADALAPAVETLHLRELCQIEAELPQEGGKRRAVTAAGAVLGLERDADAIRPRRAQKPFRAALRKPT